MDFLTSPEFWLALGQIIIIDILLGGDNAVVIALACRKLPPAQRAKGIIWGTAGAIVLRVVLIAFAMTLLSLPFLKFVGALLLVWIGVKLLAPDEEGHGDVQGSDKLLAAIKTIIVADFVMSFDNVIAIAGAAHHLEEREVEKHHRAGDQHDAQGDGAGRAPEDALVALALRQVAARHGDHDGIVAAEKNVDHDDLADRSPMQVGKQIEEIFQNSLRGKISKTGSR
jgi:YjbE family integral membrane protein